LESAGAEQAIKTFSKRFPGTDPEVMTDLSSTEKTGRLLLSHAHGAMADYMGKNSQPVTEPSVVSTQRGLIRKWENLLEQKFSGGFISDEAIAKGSKLPLDTVRQLRADPGYRVSVDPITGAYASSPEQAGPIRARVIKNPTPDAPKPDLDPIRAAMARTDKQRQILSLYEQDVPLREMGRRLGMDPGNLRRQLDRMIERGKAANTQPPSQ
jgi:hypothetical protein